MRDEDWKVLMKALAIEVQAIRFSKGTTQQENDAIADYMIGVGEVIENYRQPKYIKSISDVNIRLRRELEEKELENSKLLAALGWAHGRCGNPPSCAAMECKICDVMDKYEKPVEPVYGAPQICIVQTGCMGGVCGKLLPCDDHKNHAADMADLVAQIQERQKTEHCSGTYCRYLVARKCICLCRPCAEAQKKDH